MAIVHLLVTKFDQMPRWLRVTTYLVLLVLVVYLYLSPQFITGQVIAKTSAGGYVPYRGTLIQTEVKGHILRFKTNEFGYWSIPIVSKLPGSIDIQVFHQDDASWFPLRINSADMWYRRFRIVINSKKPLVSLEVVESDRPTTIGTNLLAAVRKFMARPALADEGRKETPGAGTGARKLAPGPKQSTVGQTQRQALPGLKWFGVEPGKGPSSSVPDAIKNYIKGIVADVVGIPSTSVSNDFRLTGSAGITYVNRIQIIEAIENQYKFKIPDEHWRELITVEEIENYVHSREALAKAYPIVKEVKNPNDWYQFQRAFPKQVKPVFKK